MKFAFLLPFLPAALLSTQVVGAADPHFEVELPDLPLTLQELTEETSHRCDLTNYDFSKNLASLAFIKNEICQFNCSRAKYILGAYHLNGVSGCPKDHALGVVLIESAAIQAYPRAQCTMGQYYNYYKDFVKSRNWYRLAAEKGHIDAKYQYGIQCYNGQGGKQELKLALDLFHEAASFGHAKAKSALIMALNVLLPNGATMNNPHCQFILGSYYLNGLKLNQVDLIKIDREKGLALLSQAESGGSSEAMSLLWSLENPDLSLETSLTLEDLVEPDPFDDNRRPSNQVAVVGPVRELGEEKEE